MKCVLRWWWVLLVFAAALQATGLLATCHNCTESKVPWRLVKAVGERDLRSLLVSQSSSRRLAAVRRFLAATSVHTVLLAAGRPAAPPGGNVTDGLDDSLVSDLVELQKERRAARRDASCRPRRTPVQVPPAADPLVMYTPDCVMVPRCSGCCGHRLLHCVPTTVKNVRKKVLALRLVGGNQLDLADDESSVKSVRLEKHVSCECQCKTKAEDCTPSQQYDEANCRCVCPNQLSSGRCPDTKIWSQQMCACACARRLDCSTGLHFDPIQCRCLPAPLYRPSVQLRYSGTSGSRSAGARLSQPGPAARPSGSSGWGYSSGVIADPSAPRPAHTPRDPGRRRHGVAVRGRSGRQGKVTARGNLV